MDYEKLHKDTIAKLQEMVNSGKITVETACGICADFVPESEDERIRKSIIGFLITISSLKDGKTVSNKDFDSKAILEWVAWLEKQYADPIKEYWRGYNEGKQNVLDKYAELKKQGKQNLANSAKTCKVEQKPADLKTKAGNWYICDMEVMNENMVTVFHRDEIYYCPKDGYLDVSGALFEVGCLDVFRLATEKEIPQPKQEWSEEDYNEIETIACHLDNTNNEGMAEVLRNIRDKYYSQSQWKPSDEQMEALNDVISSRDIKYDLLSELWKDLKKLKEE